MKKRIDGYKNYSINENGEIRNEITGMKKKPYLNSKNGYFYVDLWKNNKSRKMAVHRLIAVAFIPNPENKPTVDHIDGNRQNNSLDNLRWATFSEQNSRFETKGVRSEKIIVRHFGEERKKRGGGHIRWLQCLETLEFESITEASNYFGTTISNISLMLEKGTVGRRGKTRGYQFLYADGKRKTVS